MSYTMLRKEMNQAVAIITLDYAPTLNALDMQMATELEQALHEAETSKAVKVVLLTGAGRAFCGGGDIRFMKAHAHEPDFVEKSMTPLAKKLSEIVLYLKKMTKPVICAVAGAAAGGGANLALACDIIYAANNAKFIQAFVGIGLLPDTGGGYFLPRMIGTHRAMELFMTGRPIGAEEALSCGMVNKVVPVDTLETESLAFAKKLTEGPSLAYTNMKKLLFASLYEDFEEFMEKESQLLKECSSSDDFKEGITAFLEKRKPKYTGK